MVLFKNREEAGKLLAQKVVSLRLHQPSIIALPRGGILVGRPIAELFHLPLTIFVVRKIGAPHSPEFSIGAITEAGEIYFHKPYLEQMTIDQKKLETIIHEEAVELERRNIVYGKRFLPIKDQSIIIVDDGIATGITMYASIQSLRALQPKQIIVAAPVCSQEAISLLEKEIDQMVVLHVPEKMEAVGQYYEDFHQLTDEEVIRVINQ